MYDPFMDTFAESESLQAPLQPSRSATPAGSRTDLASKPNDESGGASGDNSVHLSPPTNTRIASGSINESTKEIAAPSVATLFDPLGSSLTNPREIDSSRSQVTAKTKDLTSSASDASKNRRRPTLDPIATPANVPTPSSTDPLKELLGKVSPAKDVAEKPKPRRMFSTTPLFQPHIPSHVRITHPPSTQTSHPTQEDDEFGGFVSVPVAADPLASSPTRPASSPNEPPSRHSAVFQSFTQAAKERQEQNERRILGEFARSESSGGNFLGWLDDLEDGRKGSTASQVDSMTYEKLAAEREKKLKGEEGPYSPPATPSEGPPPQMKTPRKHISRDGSREQMSSTPSGLGPTPDSRSIASHDKSDVDQPTHEANAGVGSYFGASLPRRLSSLLTSQPTPTQMTTIGRSPSFTLRAGAGETFTDIGKENDELDTQPVFTIPTRSSVAALSSVPLPNHAGSAMDVASSTAPRVARPAPDSFLTHSTPFATIKFVPPTGAPGFKGDREWDTGNFRDQWEDEMADDGKEKLAGNAAIARKPKNKVMRLIGRKMETQGVLTRSLGDSIRKSLPALARLCSTWTLLYSLDQHGISIHTFYNLSSPSSNSLNKVSGGRKGALIVIRDAYDGVFGAWIGDGLRMIGSNAGHYGGGDSFLWRTKDTIPDPSSETDEPEVPPEVEVFRWTGRNDYVALCEPDYLSLGGGEDGKTGLYLDSTLLNGSSARCATFDNDILCAEEDDSWASVASRTVKFEVIGLEVWGLVS